MERTEHPQYDRCFEYSFRVRKKVFLNIAYHFVGSNDDPYFAISADEMNRNRTDYEVCGQAQADLLGPKDGNAWEFVAKWDYKHLRKLSDEELAELHEDVERLQAKYPYTMPNNFDAKVALDREQSK